jgi:hypothetical protein
MSLYRLEMSVCFVVQNRLWKFICRSTCKIAKYCTFQGFSSRTYASEYFILQNPAKVKVTGASSTLLRNVLDNVLIGDRFGDGLWLKDNIFFWQNEFRTLNFALKLRLCEKATKFIKSPSCFDVYSVKSKQVEDFCGICRKPEL